jgi:hypothetical protein
VQASSSIQQKETERRENKRLTPADYARAGIVRHYDWSVKDREAHDKEMERYRQYLMKLCTLTNEVAGANCQGDE